MSGKKHYLIIGGAGGIGEACARTLAASGQVTVADLDLDAAKAVAESLGGMALHCEISNPASVETCIAEAEAIAPVTGLAITAGIIQNQAFPPEEFAQDHWDHVQAVNTRGTWLAMKYAGAAMAKRGSGSIVAIASVAGHRAWPTHSYAASKAAVLSLSRGMAVEWGLSGVRVNSVSPGFTLTPRLKELIKTRGWDISTQEAQAALGRWVEPSEIAAAVAFLLSDQASAITGVDLPVDCGWLAGINWQSFAGVPAARSA